MRTGWQAKPFEACLEKVTYTNKILRRDFLDSGAYPVISQEDDFINGYWDQEADVFKVEAPVVIFGDHTKVLKYIDFDFVLGADGVKVLRPRDFLLPKFLYYQLQSLDLGSLGYARHYRLLKERQITYPSSTEQQRIVAILDRAFESVSVAKANAERSLGNARALLDSERDAAFSASDGQYSEVALGEEIELLPGFAFKSANYTESESGIRLLRGDNIVPGSLRWGGVKRWPQADAAEYSRFALEEGDIVVAMDRPWVSAGLKHAMIGASDLPALLVQRVARLRCLGNLDGRYLLHLIGSAKFMRYVVGVQTGSGVPHISGGQIKGFTFSKPPIEEQRAVAARLDCLGQRVCQLESIYRRKAGALDALGTSLLNEAFAGGL